MWTENTKRSHRQDKYQDILLKPFNLDIRAKKILLRNIRTPNAVPTSSFDLPGMIQRLLRPIKVLQSLLLNLQSTFHPQSRSSRLRSHPQSPSCLLQKLSDGYKPMNPTGPLSLPHHEITSKLPLPPPVSVTPNAPNIYDGPTIERLPSKSCQNIPWNQFKYWSLYPGRWCYSELWFISL